MNQDHHDFNELPVSVQDIAEALGLRVVINLIENFGGVELKVPHKLKDSHKLLKLGLEDANALCLYCPGDTLLVPKSLKHGNLAKRIAELEQHHTRDEVALILGVTQRHVRRVANSSPKPTNQIDLFDE